MSRLHPETLNEQLLQQYKQAILETDKKLRFYKSLVKKFPDKIRDIDRAVRALKSAEANLEAERTLVLEQMNDEDVKRLVTYIEALTDPNETVSKETKQQIRDEVRNLYPEKIPF